METPENPAAVTIRMDHAEWERGRADAAAGRPAAPGADGYSYFAGRVEGEAERKAVEPR
jgi:hypothetical protein